MHSKPYVLQALKYATLTIAAIVLVIAFVAFTKNAGSLTGRVLISKTPGVIPTMHFTAEQAMRGFTAPADTHVIFVVPPGVRIPRITFFGGQDYDQTVPYWGVQFTGNEEARKAAGKTGKDIYDGHFFYSLAERQSKSIAPPAPADNDLLGIKKGTAPAPRAPASIAEIFTEGEYYLMTSRELYAGVDNDGDDINNPREYLAGTDPDNPDTDGDGITDGIEVMIGHTNPLDPDSDHDGLDDGVEDKNRNGIGDYRETSPLAADSDHDGLCDGTGSDNGCPEKKEMRCQTDRFGDRVCSYQVLSPVYGEDINQNGIVDAGETDPTNPNTYGKDDYDYKWDQFLSKNPDSTLRRAPGTNAPEFPIPAMPTLEE